MLALRDLRTLCIRTRAFGTWLGENLPLIFAIWVIHFSTTSIQNKFLQYHIWNQRIDNIKLSTYDKSVKFGTSVKNCEIRNQRIWYYT